MKGSTHLIHDIEGVPLAREIHVSTLKWSCSPTCNRVGLEAIYVYPEFLRVLNVCVDDMCPAPMAKMMSHLF